MVYEYLKPEVENHQGKVIDTIIWWSKSYQRMFKHRRDVFEAYRKMNVVEENEVLAALIGSVRSELAEK